MDTEECFKDFIHLMKKLNKVETLLDSASRKFDLYEYGSNEWNKGIEIRISAESMLDGVHRDYDKSIEIQLEEIEEDCDIRLPESIKESRPDVIREELKGNEIYAAEQTISALENSVSENINIELERN